LIRCRRLWTMTFGVDLSTRSDKTAAVVFSNALRPEDESVHGEVGLAEQERTALIAAIVSVVRADGVPVEVHQAALTLVGWLARRCRKEKPCQRGLVEARKQLVRVTTRR